MNRVKSLNPLIALSILIMTAAFVKQANADPPGGPGGPGGVTIACSAATIGCRDWTLIGHECPGYFSNNFMYFANRSWGCTPSNYIVNNKCNEDWNDDSCCYWTNTLDCSSVPANCPCPP